MCSWRDYTRGGLQLPNLVDVLEEALLLLVVQGVGMGDVVQSLLRLQGGKHNVILSLHISSPALFTSNIKCSTVTVK